VQNLCHPGNCSWTAWPTLKKLDNLNKKNSGLQIFQEISSYLKLLGTGRVTLSKFHSEDPQILGATVQNLFSWALCIMEDNISKFELHEDVHLLL